MRQAQKFEYEGNKLVKRLRRQVGRAIGDFDMIGGRPRDGVHVGWQG